MHKPPESVRLHQGGGSDRPLPLPLEEVEEKRGIPLTSVLPKWKLASDQAPNRSEKITDYTSKRRKSPTTHSRKSPTTRPKKSPTNYVPRALGVVVGREELKVLLKKQGQVEWCSEVRVGGLLLVLHYILIGHHSKGTRISGGLARDLVSALKRPKREGTIQQPLDVLEEIGLLTKLREAIFTPHVRDCALYVIPSAILANKRKEDVHLSPGQIKKLENAEARDEKRLNKLWSWREPLMEVLRGSISLSSRGTEMALDLVCDGQKEEVIKRMNRFLKRPEELAKAWDAMSGQIYNNVCFFPKELKQELLLDDEQVALCDISHAHHDLLPILLMTRVAYLKGKDAPPEALQAYRDEMKRLQEFLSDGDYYRKWCIDELDDNERDEKKNLLTMILNWRNSEAENNGLYRRMRSKFPRTFQIVEDLKRKDHRVLGIQLRHYMAEAINPALLELQAKGIKSIPDCDAIIVPARFKEVACEAIGRAMYKLTGVCCNVDNVRYQPPANGQHAAACITS